MLFALLLRFFLSGSFWTCGLPMLCVIREMTKQEEMLPLAITVAVGTWRTL